MSTTESAAGTDATPREFRPTLWTVVLRAKDPSAPDRREALERLFQTYWKPVYFLIRRTHDPEAAQDIAQGFFTAFLEKDFLRSVERDKGKFRTFLCVALRHYMADENDRARAQKRGGGRLQLSLDFNRAETEISREPVAKDNPDKIFQRQWALEVIKRSLQALRAEFQASDRLAEFEAISLYLSAGGKEAPSHADLARRLKVSESDINNRVHRLRQRYRELILEEIGSYSESEEESQQELRDLFSAFA
jgi:RNA polymerase sigma factor (sigma-70 family)